MSGVVRKAFRKVRAIVSAMSVGHSAVCCIVLQCVAVCCSVLQYVYEISAVGCKAFRKVRAVVSAVTGTAV